MNVAFYDRPPIPWLLRALGCFECTRRAWRFRWGEVSWNWGLALEIASFEEGWSLIVKPIFGHWYINLPRWLPHKEPHDIIDSWGVHWPWSNMAINLHFHWGRRSKVFFLPWYWERVRHEVLKSDGTWRPRKGVGFGESYDSAHDPLPDVHVERHPYHYLKASGDVQHVTVTAIVGRGEWRIRMLRWLPWPRKRSQYIDFWFSDEIGEQAGSWKGGCLGSTCEMRPGETPRHTLQRMQEERRFD